MSTRTDERLFMGVYPCGIVYADRHVEAHGDYKRLAFLPYRTLLLDLQADCLPDLAVRIRAHASTMEAMRGQPFNLSSTGQPIILGQ